MQFISVSDAYLDAFCNMGFIFKSFSGHFNIGEVLIKEFKISFREIIIGTICI